MNLKQKVVGCISILGLTVSLAACGQPNTSESGDKGDTTLSDVLNGKEKRKIVMTERKGHTGDPQILWAGYIGDGKMEIHPYSNLGTEFHFDELANENDKEYKKTIKDRDKEYANQTESNKKLDIKAVKAKTVLNTEDNKRADITGFDYKAKGNKEDKYDQLEYGFDTLIDKHPEKWMEMGSSGEDNEITLHVEAKNGEKNLNHENMKKVKDKYNNIRVVKRN
ncbi:hypothetical protein [Staphylococcus gallinarum]|uniref:hypothetical protein n=1 Tax=Staphylococcus gallinarum TaxID=1293 RepID=UPI001E31036C|nr:hypothetical protein [Staphylococcus gallinarum]MCD8845183.1 hypothetical protein [Staphylococcus gallinarum]